MNKLFDSHPIGVETQLFEQVQRKLVEAVVGNSGQFFYNIDVYLNEATDARDALVRHARLRIAQIAETHEWGIEPQRFLQGVTDDYLAIFGVLENYVSVGVDMNGKGYPTALYTRSLAVINHLINRGQIEGDIDKPLDNILKAKTERSIRQGDFVTVRLDHVTTKNGLPIFKLSTPRSNLHIGSGKQFVFIPVPFFYLLESMLSKQFATTPFRFMESRSSGTYIAVAGLTHQVVQEVYRTSPENLVLSKMRKVKPHYDVIQQKYLVYDLEASLHSLGVTSFRPEMLDRIEPISVLQVDTSRHSIDFSLLRGIYKTRVKAANTEQLASLKLLNLDNYATLKDKQESIADLGERKSDKELYYIMKSNPQVFGDIEESLTARERVSPKFMKNLSPVLLPVSQEERYDVLNDMLNRGVVKFTALKKDGGLFERVATNNPKVLFRILGKDYVKEYESIRNKLYYVRRLLNDGKATSKLHLEKLGVDYNILDYIEQRIYFSDGIMHGDASDAIDAINEGLAKLNATSSGRGGNPTDLIYRNLQVTDSRFFYGRVDVNNIVSVDFASAEPVKQR